MKNLLPISLLAVLLGACGPVVYGPTVVGKQWGWEEKRDSQGTVVERKEWERPIYANSTPGYYGPMSAPGYYYQPMWRETRDGPDTTDPNDGMRSKHSHMEYR